MNVSFYSMLRRYPMDRPFHFAPGKPAAALRKRVIGAAKLRNLTCIRVLDHFLAPDEIRPLQPYLGIQAQPVKALRRLLHKVVPLDINGFGKRNLSFSHRLVLTVVFNH